jgi:S-formylglutathione hydrolase FrmB
MAFCELQYFSPALGKQMACNVIVPERADLKRPFAVFYLLHGLSDNHTIWHRRTSIERYVEGLPLVVVMPDGGRSFYVNSKDGQKWGDSIVNDLVGLIDRTFPTRAERGGRAIGGLSMGGYGAVRLALGHPDKFASANSHSGALAFAHKPIVPNNPQAQEFARIVGENPVGGPNDLFTLAQHIDKEHLPKLRIDCGTEDFLLQDNRDFHKHLEDLKLPHEYQEFPGAHNWEYWDNHVREAIAFHRKNLGI